MFALYPDKIPQLAILDKARQIEWDSTTLFSDEEQQSLHYALKLREKKHLKNSFMANGSLSLDLGVRGGIQGKEKACKQT